MAIGITLQGSASATMQEMVDVLNASSDAAINVATYTWNSTDSRVDIEYDTAGITGNTYTLEMDSLSGTKMASSDRTLTEGSNAKYDAMNFIKDEDQYHLIAYNKATGNLDRYEDFYGDNNSKVLGHFPSESISMVNHNKEVHVGTGNTSGSNTMWIGIPQEKSFGGEIDKEVIIAKAEVNDPEGINFFHKLVTDGTHAYGFAWGNSTLYKILLSDGSIAATSTFGTYTSLRCIDYHNSKLWVMDKEDSSNGVLYEIDTTSLFPKKSITINDYSRTSGTFIYDMIFTNTKIWFAHSSRDLQKDKMLFNATIPTSSGFMDLTDRTPPVSYDYWKHMIREGQSPNDQYRQYAVSSQKYTKFYKISLTRIGNSTSHVGWLVDLKKMDHNTQSGSDMQTKTFHYGSTVNSTEWNGNVNFPIFSPCIHIVPEAHDRVSRVRINYINKNLSSSLQSIYDDGTNLVTVENDIIQKWSSPLSSASTGITSVGSVSVTADLEHLGEDLQGRVTADFDATHYLGFTVKGYSSVKKIVKSNLTQIDVLSNSLMEITLSDVSATETFPLNKGHDYKFSFTYDGYQESPLSGSVYNITDSGDTGDGSPSKRIKVKFAEKLTVPKRVSHVSIYRSTDGAYYRLIEQVPLDDPRWVLATDGSAELELIDKFKAKAAYEHLTGMPQTMTNTHVHYRLSTEINNNLIVGDCWHEEIEDAKNYIFKSKNYRFDVFDWSADFLKLPVTPNALKGFNGRIFSFSDNKTIRINPASMTIEDIFDGGGCVSQNAIIVTEYGMFYADTHNIFMHTGNKPESIGDAILRSTEGLYGWQDGAKSNITLSYDQSRNSLLVFFTRSAVGYCWAYNLLRKRWDLWDAPIVNSAVTGKDGEVYISDDSKLYKYIGGSGKRNWEYQSKDITVGLDTQRKMFYKLRGIGDAHTLQYKVYQNGTWSGSWQSLVETFSGSGVYEKIASSDKKSSAIRLKVTPSAATNELDSIGIIYRRLPVR